MSDIKQKIVSEIKKIYDPEIPVNIYELGLIYKIEVNEQKKVNIEMTLTSPNCPVAEELPNAVKNTFEPSGLKSISEGFDTRPAKEIDCLKVGLTSAKE